MQNELVEVTLKVKGIFEPLAVPQIAEWFKKMQRTPARSAQHVLANRFGNQRMSSLFGDTVTECILLLFFSRVLWGPV